MPFLPLSDWHAIRIGTLFARGGDIRGGGVIPATRIITPRQRGLCSIGKIFGRKSQNLCNRTFCVVCLSRFSERSINQRRIIC